MARIANVSLDELGKKIFSASTGSKSAEELLFSDYKEFHIAGHDLAVAQITCVDSPSMLQCKEEFLQLMQKRTKQEHLDLMILMLTDVLHCGTELVFLGDEEIIEQAFDTKNISGQHVFLPGVVSRKKQIVPALAALWG